MLHKMGGRKSVKQHVRFFSPTLCKEQWEHDKGYRVLDGTCELFTDLQMKTC